MLKFAWHFTCCCPRCTAGEELPWKIQSAIECLGKEVDKYGDGDPDRWLNQYRYVKSPASIVLLSCQSAKYAVEICAFVLSLAVFGRHYNVLTCFLVGFAERIDCKQDNCMLPLALFGCCNDRLALQQQLLYNCTSILRQLLGHVAAEWQP